MNKVLWFMKYLARTYPKSATLARPYVLAVILPIINTLAQMNFVWTRLSVGRSFSVAWPTFVWWRMVRPTLEGAPSLLKFANTTDAKGIGTSASGRRILMLLVSNIWIDPRVEREARALAAAGYLVDVICPDLSSPEGCRPAPNWGANVRIILIESRAASYCQERPGFLAERLFNAALTISLKREYLAVHAHDLNTSLAAFAVARTTGAHLVVDFHEWASENVHWSELQRAWVPYDADWKQELQDLEARVMREASAVITVSQSIVDALAEELGNGRRATLIRNIPRMDAVPTRGYLPLKAQFDLPDDRFVLLYQGGTGPTRLLEPVIQALAFAPECTLIIRGPSLDVFGDGYTRLARDHDCADRLILAPPVPSRDVVAAARGADAGVWNLPALCRNFTYALPNKIFEYLAAGLPVLVGAYPEAARLVARYKVGLSFTPNDPRAIAAAINQLIENPALTETLRHNTAVALRELDAGAEWQKLVALYDALPQKKA